MKKDSWREIEIQQITILWNRANRKHQRYCVKMLYEPNDVEFIMHIQILRLQRERERGKEIDKVLTFGVSSVAANDEVLRVRERERERQSEGEEWGRIYRYVFKKISKTTNDHVSLINRRQPTTSNVRSWPDLVLPCKTRPITHEKYDVVHYL